MIFRVVNWTGLERRKSRNFLKTADVASSIGIVSFSKNPAAAICAENTLLFAARTDFFADRITPSENLKVRKSSFKI